MKSNNLSLRSIFSILFLSFVLLLTSCSSDSNDDIDVSQLSEVKKQAIDKIEKATNLTKEEKKDFKNEIADVQDQAVAEVLAKANTYLPVSFKNLEFVGYFGQTVPPISVKWCHFEKSYNNTKKVISNFKSLSFSLIHH